MKINNLLVLWIRVFYMVRLTSFVIIKKENVHMQKTIKCEHFLWTNIERDLQLAKKWLHTFCCHCCVQQFAFVIMIKSFNLMEQFFQFLNKKINFLLWQWFYKSLNLLCNCDVNVVFMKYMFCKYNNSYELNNNLWNHFVVLCGTTNWKT
jgi:hypothetical protein